MDLLAQKVIDHARVGIDRLLTENGFTLGAAVKIERRLFATEAPQLLFLEFAAEYNCPSSSGTDRASGTLIVSGDGIYNTDTSEFGRLRTSGEVLRFVSEDGTEKKHRNIYASANLHLGHREVASSIRYELD